MKEKAPSNSSKSFGETLKTALKESFNLSFLKTALIVITWAMVLGTTIVAFMHSIAAGFACIITIIVFLFFYHIFVDDKNESEQESPFLAIVYTALILFITSALGLLGAPFLQPGDTLTIPEYILCGFVTLFFLGILAGILAGILWWLYKIAITSAKHLKKIYQEKHDKEWWSSKIKIMIPWLRRLLLIAIFVAVVWAIVTYTAPIL